MRNEELHVYVVRQHPAPRAVYRPPLAHVPAAVLQAIDEVAPVGLGLESELAEDLIAAPVAAENL